MMKRLTTALCILAMLHPAHAYAQTFSTPNNVSGSTGTTINLGTTSFTPTGGISGNLQAFLSGNTKIPGLTVASTTAPASGHLGAIVKSEVISATLDMQGNPPSVGVPQDALTMMVGGENSHEGDFMSYNPSDSARTGTAFTFWFQSNDNDASPVYRIMTNGSIEPLLTLLMDHAPTSCSGLTTGYIYINVSHLLQACP